MPLLRVLGIGKCDIISDAWLGPNHCPFIADQLNLRCIVLDTGMGANTSQQVTWAMFISSEQIVSHQLADLSMIQQIMFVSKLICQLIQAVACFIVEAQFNS